LKILESIKEAKEFVRETKKENLKLGFVPTMGFLHKGHLSLMERAKIDCDIVVASIFVNPLQFGQGEDFESYPSSLEKDFEKLRTKGVDAIFLPKASELYPVEFQTYVEVTEVSQNLCGASRPDHFKGVTTVVAKLFNIVEADKAYFGLKDAQQVQVIKQMVRDLNMNVEIIPLPIVREVDGLAMSSRNAYLNPEQRKAALILNKALMRAKQLMELGEQDAKIIKEEIEKKINLEQLARIDYVELVDFETFKSIAKIEKNVLVALAVRVGETRLIDNFLWEG